MASAEVMSLLKSGFKPGFRWRMLGTPAPVFPGFEVDISDRVGDEDKPDAVWHRERARAILQAHPEVKELFGTNTVTAFYCLAWSFGQIGIAALMSTQPWWVMLITAYIIGSYINICLFELAHQCNHCLVFKKASWNRWLFTVTSLPMFLSGHHTWWVEHLVHHNDLGAKKDFITRRRSFLLWTRRASPLFLPYSFHMLTFQIFRSVFGLICYLGDLLRGRTIPSDFTLKVLGDEHLASGYKKNKMERWAVVYPLLSLGLLVVLAVFGGWKPVAYLALSQAFMTGFLHPLMFGIVLSISHFHGHKTYQPTSSYYGWLNKIMFNLGIHTEHHDIMAIPGKYTPQLRKIAPEYYDDLLQIKSFVGLAYKFVFADGDNYEADFANEDNRNRKRFGGRTSALVEPVAAN